MVAWNGHYILHCYIYFEKSLVNVGLSRKNLSEFVITVFIKLKPFGLFSWSKDEDIRKMTNKDISKKPLENVYEHFLSENFQLSAS